MTEKVHDCLILKMTRDRCHMLIDQGKTEICYFGDIIDFLMTVAINPRLLGQRDQIRFWLKWNVQFLETWNSDLLILFLLPFLYSTPFHLFPRCSGSDWNFDDSYLRSFWCCLGGALEGANQSTRWLHRFEICFWRKFQSTRSPKEELDMTYNPFGDTPDDVIMT